MGSQNRRPFFNNDLGFALLFLLLDLALISACIWGADGHFGFGIFLVLLLFLFLAVCSFLSGREKLKNAREFYDMQNPELAKKQRAKTRKILKITIPSAIVCALAITIIAVCVHKNKTEAAIELYKAEVAAVCEKWQRASIEFEMHQSIYVNNIYHFDVSGAIGGRSQQEKYENIYQLIKELRQIRSSYSRISLSTGVIVSGTRYNIGADGKELYDSDYHTVYTHLSEYDKSFLSKLSKDVPYIGLSDDYINDTALGPYDDVEFCKDYLLLQPDHQSKEYIWYEDGKEIFSASVLEGEVISTYDRRSSSPIMKYKGNS